MPWSSLSGYLGKSVRLARQPTRKRDWVFISAGVWTRRSTDNYNTTFFFMWLYKGILYPWSSVFEEACFPLPNRATTKRENELQKKVNLQRQYFMVSRVFLRDLATKYLKLLIDPVEIKVRVSEVRCYKPINRERQEEGGGWGKGTQHMWPWL